MPMHDALPQTACDGLPSSPVAVRTAVRWDCFEYDNHIAQQRTAEGAWHSTLGHVGVITS